MEAVALRDHCRGDIMSQDALGSPNPLFLPFASDHIVLLHVKSIDPRFWEGVGFCLKISWAACRWGLGLPGSLPTGFQTEIAAQILCSLILVTIKNLEFLFWFAQPSFMYFPLYFTRYGEDRTDFWILSVFLMLCLCFRNEEKMGKGEGRQRGKFKEHK